MYNILLGGAAGDGMDTMAMLLEKSLKQAGYYIFTTRDVMSRVRGGHNFLQIRFGLQPILNHCEELDGIFAVNEETISIHLKDLKKDGFILADRTIDCADPRAILLPLNETAKELGNQKASTSVAIGAMLSMFGIDISNMKHLLEVNLKPKLIDVNLLAMQRGYTLLGTRYHEQPQNLEGHILLSGTKASTLGAMAAGLKFYSAYPMSPSTEVLDYLLAHGEAFGIDVEQAEDEIAAINMAIGASYAGAVAMCGSSGGGFCLMVEALGFAGIAEIPLVVMDVQRPGPATGLPTRTEQSDLKFVISASQGEFPRMVIALRNHEDAFYQTARAVAIAKKYQMPVIVLSDQHLGDSTATVPLFDTSKIYQDTSEQEPFSLPYKSYEYTQSGISTRLIPGKSEHLVRVDSDEHDEFGVITESAEVRNRMMEKRMGKLKMLEAELMEPEFIGEESCSVLLVGFGSVDGAVKEAIALLNETNKTFGALMFGDVYPLPVNVLKQYATPSCKVISVEQNATGQFASLLREAALVDCWQSILKYDGRQLSASYIVKAVQRLLGGQSK